MSQDSSGGDYIRLKKDADGIVELVFDQPDKKVNVMGVAFDTAFKAAIAELEADKENIKGIYLCSAKPGQFFAGGDVKEMMNMPLDQSAEDRRVLFDAMMATKQPFRQLETLGVPVAVGINGAALGGGYEICLACHRRFALDHPSLQVGLPESQLGLLPGAGGIVRLTRMLGMQEAITLISTGKRLKADQALAKGLVDELASSEEEMRDKARAWLLSEPEPVQPWDKKGFRIPGGAPKDAADDQGLQGLLFFGPVNVMNQTHGNMPAQRAIFAAICDTARVVDFDTASEIETRYFLKLLLSPVARNMMTTFFVQMNAVNSGLSRPEGVPKREVRRLGLLGAGQMGAGLAMAAARAGIEVVLKDVDQAAAERGVDYVRKACEKSRRIDEHKTAEILGRIQPTGTLGDLADCDAIIEAVFEDRAVKAKVSSETEAILAEDALFTSNTSALPITELAEATQRPENFIGMHFFSPAERMPLVEIIRGAKTSDETLARTFDLGRQLGKTPIVVNDGVGFFTSRVIGKMMGQGLSMVTEGVPPALIENAARFAGYPVGPLALMDEISLDTAMKASGQAIEDATARGETMAETAVLTLCRRMVLEFDRKGKVFGGGFYEYPEGGGKYLWPQLKELYAGGCGQGISLEDVQDRILFAEALEAVRAMEEGIIESVPDGNIGSIMGIGFPAHTGGVFQFFNYRGLKASLERCRELAERYGEDDFKVPQLLVDRAQSGEAFV